MIRYLAKDGMLRVRAARGMEAWEEKREEKKACAVWTEYRSLGGAKQTLLIAARSLQIRQAGTLVGKLNKARDLNAIYHHLPIAHSIISRCSACL